MGLNRLFRVCVLAPLFSHVFLLGMVRGSCRAESGPTPPLIEKRPVKTVLFGDERVDEYSWLHQRDSAEVTKHLEAENEYTDSLLARYEEIRNNIYEEMIERIPDRDTRPPMRIGDFEYYEKHVAGQDYPTICRRAYPDGTEQTILDINTLVVGDEYLRVPIWRVSPDHQKIAFIEERDGDDNGRIRIREIAGGTNSNDTIIEDTWVNSLAWDGTGEFIYYVRVDATQRPASAWRHRVGSSASDEILFEEPDGRFAVDVYRTRSDSYVMIHAAADDTSQVLAVGGDYPESTPRVIFPKRQGISASRIEHRRGADGGWFYTIDDDKGAKDGRLVRRLVNGTADAAWEVVLSETRGVSLLNLVVLSEWIALEERRDGYRVIRVMRHDLSNEHVVGVCPVPGWTTLEQGPDYEASTIQIETSAPLEELTTYEYDPDKRTAVIATKRQTKIDTTDYAVSTIYGIAGDGTRIPVTVIYRKDNPMDRTSPAILTGYGAVGVTMEPGFYPTRTYASMLERGCTIAIAHVRGGGFYGPRWHDQAKLETKSVSFTDFIACAEALITQGFASPDTLAFVGGSSGGLLVAASINLRPDIAKVVVAEVPFVDCLNSMLDPNLPATTLDYPEMGNPAEERYYRAIRSYAPYENIGPRDYPDILAIGGINDVRVAYWEPAKWVARIRERRLDQDGLTMLRINLGAGHEGSSGRRDALMDQAEVQAFILGRLMRK